MLKVVCPWDQALCPAHPVVYIKMQILLALKSLCLKLVPWPGLVVCGKSYLCSKTPVTRRLLNMLWGMEQEGLRWTGIALSSFVGSAGLQPSLT